MQSRGGYSFLKKRQLILSNSKVGLLISGYEFCMGEAKAGKRKNPTKLVEPVLEKRSMSCCLQQDKKQFSAVLCDPITY